MLRVRLILLALVLTAALGPAVGAADTEGLTASENVRFVKNLQFEKKHAGSSRLSVDMDFLTTTVTKLSNGATGDPVCVEDAEQPDGCARDESGAIVYQTEERDFAFVGTYMNGLQVVDITDPESPVVVNVYDCVIAQSDVNLFERPDLGPGAAFVAYTSDDNAGQTNFTSRCHRDNAVGVGRYGTFIVDVSDPRNPRSASFIQFAGGTHQANVHPSGRWVYSAPGGLTAIPGNLHVADVTDPYRPGAPVAVGLTTGADAHDVIFSEDGRRAYVTAHTHSAILDTTNPGSPEVIGRILDPTVTIHHEAHPYTTLDPITGEQRTYLLLVDELAGASGNEVCPGGGIHIYDITGDLERTPVKLGLYEMPLAAPAEGAPQGTAGTKRCTAHVMQVHPDEGIAIIGWFAAGTRILDLSRIVGVSAGATEDLGSQGTGIREIGYARFNDGDVWAAKTNRIEDDGTFYVYAADTARMFDVFQVDLGGKPSGRTVSAGGAVHTRNVEWLAGIPAHAGSSGGKLVGKYYYLTDPRGLFIYDVSRPEIPQLVGSLPAGQSTTHTVFAQEDPDTNGKILLVNGFTPGPSGAPPTNGWLLIVDVQDKSAPKVIGSMATDGYYDHTWTCILDCTYAIGRTGHILDLRDPTQPKKVADWRTKVSGANYMHDFTEVRPGYVVGSGQPSLYLDVTDPLNPKEIARINPQFHALGYHGAAWPKAGTDPLLLMGAEVAPQGNTNTAGSDCADERVHAVATYDATETIDAGSGRRTFRKLDEFRVKARGAYIDGNAPFHVLYCGHWFDPHPRWDAGGVLAMGHYDWGTRFLRVRSDGRIGEIGWFIPVQGFAASANWISDDIVYVHDYRRGLDILRFTGRTR